MFSSVLYSKLALQVTSCLGWKENTHRANSGKKKVISGATDITNRYQSLPIAYSRYEMEVLILMVALIPDFSGALQAVFPFDSCLQK